MVRTPCCEKVGLKKGKWTAEEDELLIKYIQANGEGSWRSLPKNAGLWRCGKSCRLRWTNYLRPDLKRGKFTADEDDTIVKLHSSLGNRWSLIANHFPGRTDNEIKNYWISNLRRRLYNFRHKGIIKNTIEVPKMAVVGDEYCECSRKRDRVSQSKSKKYKNNMAAYESTCHGGCGGATWSESGSNKSLLPENYTTDTEFPISPLTERKGLETQQHEHHLESEISEQRKGEAEDNNKKDIYITLEKQQVCNGMLEEQQNEYLHDFENWCDMNYDYFLEEQKWVDQYSSSLNLEFGSIEDCLHWDDSLLWLWND